MRLIRSKDLRHKMVTIIDNGPPRWLSGKEPTCQCGICGFDPWVQKIPWRRKWQATPVFLPGESHGQRSLAGYSPGSQTDTTERLTSKLIKYKLSGECGAEKVRSIV